MPNITRNIAPSLDRILSRHLPWSNKRWHGRDKQEEEKKYSCGILTCGMHYNILCQIACISWSPKLEGTIHTVRADNTKHCSFSFLFQFWFPILLLLYFFLSRYSSSEGTLNDNLDSPRRRWPRACKMPFASARSNSRWRAQNGCKSQQRRKPPGRSPWTDQLPEAAGAQEQVQKVLYRISRMMSFLLEMFYDDNISTWCHGIWIKKDEQME